jgi:hypothetical protein
MSALAVVLVASAVTTAHARGGAYLVQNNKDSGPGSLRYGLEVEEASKIVIPAKIGNIRIDSTLMWNSTKPLTINGSRQTIVTDANVTLLTVAQGADLTIKNLDFRGPGGWSILNRGDLNGPPGKGIFVDLRDDQTGKIRVELKNVSVRGAAFHGVHISDCSLADDCGGGSGGGGDGSPASIEFKCTNCTVIDNGFGTQDGDGVRGDERGMGSIYATIKNSTMNRNGADGLELDEGDDGNVWLSVRNSEFNRNGQYCDPEILGEFIPDPDEAGFDESEEVTEDDIPGPVEGSPDDDCIEFEVDKYDSGFVEAYEYGIDTDDGVDLDEAADGSIWSLMVNTDINANFDEGVDYDEEGEGDINATYVRTRADRNNDDGYKHTEEDGGDMYSNVRAAQASGNGGAGFVYEEEDAGDLYVNVRGSRTSGNDDGDGPGIEAVQELPGTGVLRVRGSSTPDGIETDDGVDEL